MRNNCLLNGNFSPANALAGEAAEFAGREGYDAVAGSVDSVIGAELSAITSTLGQADLANNNLASRDFLAAEQLNAKALALTVSGIFGGTASFHM